MKGQRGGQPPFLGWGLVQDCSKTINYKPKDASLLQLYYSSTTNPKTKLCLYYSCTFSPQTLRKAGGRGGQTRARAASTTKRRPEHSSTVFHKLAHFISRTRLARVGPARVPSQQLRFATTVRIVHVYLVLQSNHANKFWGLRGHPHPADMACPHATASIRA